MPDKQTVERTPMSAIPEKLKNCPGDCLDGAPIVHGQAVCCICDGEGKIISPAWADYMEAREKKWQAMCQRFVGAGMLADEFADVPHDPETFGNYVQNLNDQIASCPVPRAQEYLKG